MVVGFCWPDYFRKLYCHYKSSTSHLHSEWDFLSRTFQNHNHHYIFHTCHLLQLAGVVSHMFPVSSTVVCYFSVFWYLLIGNPFLFQLLTKMMLLLATTTTADSDCLIEILFGKLLMLALLSFTKDTCSSSLIASSWSIVKHFSLRCDLCNFSFQLFDAKLVMTVYCRNLKLYYLKMILLFSFAATVIWCYSVCI